MFSIYFAHFMSVADMPLPSRLMRLVSTHDL